jgi:hypothetical protein
VIGLHGPGLAAARQRLADLEVAGEDGPVPVLPIHGGGGLRIVPAYKHLGRHAAGSGRMAKEIAYRCGSAASASGALMRRVFAARGIPVADRAHVAQACVVSRLLHGAGTWLPLSAAQLRKVQGQYMRPLRRIAGHDCPPPAGGSWPSAVATLRATGQAPVQAHVAAARLRLAARITTKGTPAVRGLAQSWSGARWRRGLLHDMRLMHAVLRDRLRELPDPAVAPGVWEDLWRQHPGPWNSLVRRMVTRAAADPAAFLALDAAGGMATADADQLQGGGAGQAAAEAVPAAASPVDVTFLSTASAPAPVDVVFLSAASAPGPVDVTFLSTASAPAPVDVAAAGLAGVAAAQLAPAPAGDGGAAAGEAMELVAAQGLVGALAAPAGVPVQQPFACQECGKEFLSQRGLLCHGTHAHGRQRPSAAFVLGPICPGCGNNYRTRARAMEHVERGSARCRTAVLEAGLVPADPVAVAAADDADRIRRRQARQAGLSELAGPPAILHRGA